MTYCGNCGIEIPEGTSHSCGTFTTVPSGVTGLYYPPVPVPLTEERVRDIVRAELAEAARMARNQLPR